MPPNVGFSDRVIRTLLAAMLTVALVALGSHRVGNHALPAGLLIPLILLLTGLIGYCPLYGLLRLSTYRP